MNHEDIPSISNGRSGKRLSKTFEANDISFFEEKEELPPHVIAGIQRGQADIEAGRTISLDEFKKRIRLNN